MDPRHRLLLQHLPGAVVGLWLAYTLLQIADGRRAPLEEVAGYASTQGTMLAAEVVERDRGSDGQRAYADLEVRYRYAVGDEEYEGERYRPAPRRESLGTARNFARTFPPGAAVEVWYDPADPARSVLERAPTRDTETLLRVLPPVAWGLVGVVVLSLLTLAGRWRRAGKATKDGAAAS